MTTSQRAPSEILVPLRTQAAPSLPAHAVEIRVGETLCLSAGRRRKGPYLEPLSLVARGRAPEVALELVLTQLPGGTTLMRIQNNTPHTIEYEALIPFGQTPYLASSRIPPLWPGRSAFESWPSKLDRILLFGFETGHSLPVALERRRARGAERVEQEGTLVGAGVQGFYGVRPLGLQELDRELSRNVYSGAPTALALGGGTLWFTLGRLRLELQIYSGHNTARSRSTGSRAGLGLAVAGLDVGWETLRFGGFMAYPFVGVADGTLTVDVPSGDPPVLRETLAAFQGERKVAAGGGLFGFGVAFEQLVQVLTEDQTGYVGLSVGMKLGYHQQYSHSSWELVDKNMETRYRGGPRVQLGGPYALFSVGIPLRTAGR